MQGLQGKFDFESLGKGVLDNLRQVSPAAGICPQLACAEKPSCMVQVVEEYPQSGQAPAKPGALEVSETEAFWQVQCLECACFVRVQCSQRTVFLAGL